MASEFTARNVHNAVVTRVLQGNGEAPHPLRRAAFDNAGLEEPLRRLINKVAAEPTRVTDDDIGAVKRSGLTEDQIFELVICAAIGQSSRLYETALSALDKVSASDPGEHAS
ncbi:MAG TPA: hypothetical protein VMV68_10370 [Spirochaetia bacterium]|nr:hypothetical protein [Spirochaetia bacterium]